MVSQAIPSARTRYQTPQKASILHMLTVIWPCSSMAPFAEEPVFLWCRKPKKITHNFPFFSRLRSWRTDLCIRQCSGWSPTYESTSVTKQRSPVLSSSSGKCSRYWHVWWWRRFWVPSWYLWVRLNEINRILRLFSLINFKPLFELFLWRFS